MKITFIGAVQTVTGSKYLLESNGKKILLDCGLFQGQKDLRRRNWDAFPINPAEIDAIVLSHAHIDHSGYIPRFIKNDFKGKIYCTAATKALCEILLPDCGHIQEEEARLANKYGYSKHKPAEPLYSEKEARDAINYFHTLNFGESYSILPDAFSVQFNRAGHILGAATVDIRDEHHSIIFSGDLGRPVDPIMRSPVYLSGGDYLVIESTYGNRLHHEGKPLEMLEAIINKTIKRGGSVIIPAFAVGRAQMMLYYIHELKKNKRIPNIPVYLDSPLAVNATNIFETFHTEHKLSSTQTKEVCDTATYTNTAEDSKALDAQTYPMILISASGMATGGRVLHHLKVFLPEQKNLILFTGYQAKGTRGDRLVNGETEIKIHGQMIPVHAQIEQLHNLSAHADYKEILSWLHHLQKVPAKVFITHGETEAANGLKEHIENELKWNCVIPEYLQSFDL